MNVEDVTIIKSIATPQFELAMIEAKNGQYYVIYELQGNVVYSEPTKDYKMASFMYDAKLNELEGH